MPSHIVEVLFQGIWSSLTGGWFYDPHLSLFINTVHMYAWIFLFSFPFLIYMIFDATIKVWAVYISVVSILFILIKIINYKLNKMFDSNRIKLIEKQQTSSSVKRKLSKTRRKSNAAAANIAETELNEGIEVRNEEAPKTTEQPVMIDEITIVNENTNDKSNEAAVDIDSSSKVENAINLQNSPTNRSLFKISEESLDHQKVHFDEKQQQHGDSKNKISFSTIIAHGPSFQDTTVSDTKLFNGEHKLSSGAIEVTKASSGGVESVETSRTTTNSTANPSKHKIQNRKKNVRRYNSDLTYKNKTQVTEAKGRDRRNSSSSSSGSRPSSNERTQSNNVDLNRNASVNLSKILIEKSKSANLNNSASKRQRRRAKSFNYLFKTAIPPTPPPSIVNDSNNGQKNDDNLSNYSSASSIVSLISPHNNNKATSSQTNDQMNIDDLKETYLKTATASRRSLSTSATSSSSTSQSFSTASSRSSLSSSSSYSSIRSRESRRKENYEKQGARPKIRHHQHATNKKVRQPKQQQRNKKRARRKVRKTTVQKEEKPEILCEEFDEPKASGYDFNDTSEGTVHYFVDNEKVYRYKFNKTSFGTSELVNPNDKSFNISEIPVEFHKYLLPSKPIQASTSRQSRSSAAASTTITAASLRQRLRNNDLSNALEELRFKQPPPVPPPPLIPSFTRNEIMRQLSLEMDRLSYHESSSDWSDHKTANIDQIEAATLPAPVSTGSRHSRSNSRQDQFHMRLRSRFIHTAPHISSSSSQQQHPTSMSRTANERSSKKKTPKYKLAISEKFSIKIPFDRRSLQSMLDNNKSLIEIIAICFLAFLVSLLASVIFMMNLYQDFTLIIYCFVIASCHYSLLKSCTPDSSSPTHGFNNLLAVSRSIYFCTTCLIIIVLDAMLSGTNEASVNQVNVKLYNFELVKFSYIEQTKNFFEIFLLFQPLLFLIGLYPQINTFIISLIEQIDMNLFGGTAMQSLVGSVVSLLRSLLINSILALFLYLTILKKDENNILLNASKSKYSQTIQFSLYSSLTVLLSYLTSRQSSSYTVIYDLIKRFVLKIASLTLNSSQQQREASPPAEPTTSSTPVSQAAPATPLTDPLPKKLESVIKLRMESDILIGVFIFLFIFAIHASTVFSSLATQLNEILFLIVIPIGVLNHYLLPNLRLEFPWSVFNQPFLKQKHWSSFEPNSLAKLCWYERIYVYTNFFEKNLLNLIVLLSTMTICIDDLFGKLSSIDQNGFLSCLFFTILSTKLIRYSYCEPSKQYQLYLVSYLFNKFDVYYLNRASANSSLNCMLIDLYILSIILNKFYDFYDKLNFIFVYTAPWQLPWGSAFHAFAQPLSLPHSAFLFIQIILSCIIGSPIMPLMGSAIFLLSYMRPIKFWEKNYNTKRLDNTNTRLQSQFDNTFVDSENLNAIFYEHLTCVLQNTLCGDIQLGRWGNVYAGDFYILSSDYLNCLVHIIEIGNGFVTFQLRGLEFKGTYCQQRELEAISEDTVDNKSCCCCKIGHIRGMLSFNTIFHSKWLAWKVIERKYIVDSYRIVDNDLSLIVNFYSLRSTLIDFYIKSAVYYLIKSQKLANWLTNEKIKAEIAKIEINYSDNDTCFDQNLDCDYDAQLKAVTYSKFCTNYLKWIQHCVEKRPKSNENEEQLLANCDQNSDVSKLCFLLSLACRRALLTAMNGGTAPTNANRSGPTVLNTQLSNSSTSSSSSAGFGASAGISAGNGAASAGAGHGSTDPDSLQSFQHGYYTLFKGDIRIQSTKDEWLFNDIDLLNSVIIKSVRMALRLHQDHFQFDQTDEASLFENLHRYDNESVITYERDPIWRNAVLNNIPSLLALRHQLTEFSDQYKVVMLNKNFLSFRVIKVNKECVRSFWAGQQHELIFLRNKNQERGSIQNAKQVLRNIINSSCDQPIGYPIYVSPLTTSYSSTHKQLSEIIGSEFSFKGIYKYFRNLIQRIHNNCTNNCSGSSNTANDEQLGVVYSLTRLDPVNETATVPPTLVTQQSTQSDTLGKKCSTLTSNERPSSVRVNKDQAKQNRFTVEKVSVTDINQIVDIEILSNINKFDYATLCSKSTWGDWMPKNGMTGYVYRKHVISNNTIMPNSSPNAGSKNHASSYQLCIIKISNKYFIPIKEAGIECLHESTYL